MTDPVTHILTALPGAWLVLPLAALGVGFGVGTFHFRSLEGVARRIVAGDRRAVALQLGRLVFLGVVLALFALIGAPTLIAGAAGVLVARSRVLSRVRGAG